MSKPIEPLKNVKDLLYPYIPVDAYRKTRKAVYRERELKAPKLGLSNSHNTTYIKWLKQNSMLYHADKLAADYSGKARLWQNPYGKPKPRKALQKSSVWFTAYPVSIIKKDSETILQSLSNPKLWSTFKDIGITGMHTGPMKRAGGLDGWSYTPSIDGHFDRISNSIDPMFGSNVQFKRLCKTAKENDGIIIDDVIPGHTGKGPDFKLATMKYRNYPGVYHMIEIHEADWHILPEVPKDQESVNINEETEADLTKLNYIIGKLQRVIFYEPDVKETNWSVTRVVRGVDGTKRRWVYLHYYKEGQPSINWLDPSFNGVKLIIGDALHSIGELGSTGVRLDANGFLGLEKDDDSNTAWSEGHPLAASANEFIASMVRKVDGFTFQELGLSIDDLKTMASGGADLSYDFVNRPAYHHAIATQDVSFLQLTLNLAHLYKIEPTSLVHALQNHDELTYELVHFDSRHKDDIYDFRGSKIDGTELTKIIRTELRQQLTGKNAPYNLLFTENGLACTTATVVAGSLGYQDLSNLDDNDIERIANGHILLAMFNALQPGAFALSGWDLVGALTLDPSEIPGLLESGDTRWINRGAYDLMNSDPGANTSTFGIPKSKAIYGSLPDQLANPASFVYKLKKMLKVREEIGLATAHQLEIPRTDNKAILVMIHRLDHDRIQATVLNFSSKQITTTVKSDHFANNSTITDLLADNNLGSVQNNSLKLTLPPHGGSCLIFN